MVKKLKIIALIVAAGRGTRVAKAGHEHIVKQYKTLSSGEMVLTKTLSAFDEHPMIDAILTVIHPDDGKLYAQASPSITKTLTPVTGGATRQLSVMNGLEALVKHKPDYVLVHDGARPFVSEKLISDVIKALDKTPCALPVIDITDTLKLIETSPQNGTHISTLKRDKYKCAQTPQGFHYPALLTAHRNAKQEITDDATLMEHANITLVQGDKANIKLTTLEDFSKMNENLPYETHTALGYDVHAFEAGNAVRLGGITIPHTHKLGGHSDADVALHALTDALLGTCALGDMGDHFPASDTANKNRDSAEFLAHAVNLVAQQNRRITHLDLVIICEAPQISPHRETMRKRIAHICNIDINRVSIKATTTEKLGFTGRSEGIAAQAMASIEIPRTKE